ncbi:Cysteine desulfurase [Commensalibacter sp. Nvir]|uniref:aminotransferase class V-fold PLP-dependent enzyme n=1 Tax=Commensalibacter sp. Nvir TaxID=3069817 RepID=UPI002D2EC05F|nr:Cysteine desulfurase [Commensalibacter sp. Nvir]
MILQPKLDIKKIRNDFPILNQTINNNPFVFLDSAASAQKPLQVIEAIKKTICSHYANVHRGIYTISEKMTDDYEQVRKLIAQFINASSASEIIFTKNSTEAINLVAHSYGSLIPKGYGVLISEMEHHANIIPWQMLRDRWGVPLYIAPITDEGELDLLSFQQILEDHKIALVAITHMSNVLGTINPLKIIIELAHHNNAKVLIDGSQGIVHQKVNVEDLNADFYTFTGHKLYGPTGIGILYGKTELLQTMPPFMGGGDMIDKVTFEASTWASPPTRFEAGTQPILEIIGLGEAIRWVSSIGYEALEHHDLALLNYTLDQLASIREITPIGNPAKRGGVVSFTMEKIHAFDIATLLDQQGIAIRAGFHCAEPLMHRLKQTSVARASFGIYNTFEEIDRFIGALNKIKNMFA